MQKLTLLVVLSQFLNYFQFVTFQKNGKLQSGKIVYKIYFVRFLKKVIFIFVSKMYFPRETRKLNIWFLMNI